MTLKQTQQWLWRAILQGGASHEAMQSQLHGGSLTPPHRLNIYVQGYRARLLECMKAEFSILTKLLGEELFNQFALSYLQKTPPHSYTLFDLGAGFAEFLQDTRPDTPQAPEHWIDVMIDLVHLERLHGDVFKHRDEPGIPLDRIDTGLNLNPTLRLTTLKSPVVGWFNNPDLVNSAHLPEPALTHVALHRHQNRVVTRSLSPAEHRLLQLILEGDTESARQEIGGNTLADAWQRWLDRNQGIGIFLVPT